MIPSELVRSRLVGMLIWKQSRQNAGVIRKKRACIGERGCPILDNFSPITITTYKQLTTSLSLASTNEDVANQVSMRTGSPTKHTLETKSVNDENETEFTIELSNTSSTISRIETTTQTDNETDKTAWILSTTNQKVPTVTDSGAAATTALNGVGVFLVAVSTVLCLF